MTEPAGSLRAVLLSLLCLVPALAGCGAAPARWRPTWTAPGAQFGEDGRAAFVEARSRLDAGDVAGARDALVALAQADPENLEVGAWLQDVEALLLREGVDLFAPEFTLAADGPADNVLRKVYRARAGDGLTVPAFVLAARAETDVIAGRNLLERALELDPTSAWAHYGMAHLGLLDRARSDRWSGSRASLERALRFDPGHLRARRLEAWMAAQEGDSEAARGLIGRWIEAAQGDPRVSRLAQVEARLDLARLLLLDGKAGRAERLLMDLEGEPRARAERLMLLTVARQERGDVDGAVEAVVAAQGAARDTVLPLVQEALLRELFLGDPEGAEERWSTVAALTGETSNIADLIQGLRARVRLERAAQDRGETPEAPRP